MPRQTTKFPDETVEWIEQKSADGAEYDSKSAVIREAVELLQRFDEAGVAPNDVDDLLAARERVEKLERELEVTENRLQEAQAQMRERDQLESEVTDLATVVEETREIQQQQVDELADQVEQAQQRADAPFFVRWWRWARGGD